MDNKKKYAFLILLVFAVVVVTISASFAFFSYSREGVVNVLQMGNIEFAMLDGDNVLITNAFPQSDDEGNLNEAYSFTVKNTSSEGFDIYYNLLFLDNNKETDVNYFSNGQIKYSLVKNGVYAAKTSSTSGNKLSSINGFTIGGTTGEGVVLSKQLIKAGETDSYNLRIWISDDVDYSTTESNGLVNGAFNDYKYSLKVKIETTSGEVTYGPGLYDANDDIIYTWDELLANGYVSFKPGEDGYLLADSSYSFPGKLIIDSSVKTIGYGQFFGSQLTEVVIPEGVTTIDNSAFSNSNSLKKITIPGSVTAINNDALTNCSNLEDINLNEGLKNIGINVFSNIKASTIEFPESLEKIDSGSLAGNNFDEITFNGNLKRVYNILEGTTVGTLTFNTPNAEFGVSSIGKYNKGTRINNLILNEGSYDSSFQEHQFSSVKIGSNVKEIGSYTFVSAVINNFTFESGLTEIGQFAFSIATLPEEVTIPSSVNKIGYQAFDRVQGVKKLTIEGNGSTLIDTYAINSSSVEELIIKNVSEIGANSVNGSESLRSVRIENVPVISNNAFDSCTNLESVVMVNVKELKDYAFNGDAKINNLVLPDTLEKVGNTVFNLAGMTGELVLPSSLKTIGSCAFAYGTNTDNIVVNDNVESVNVSAFIGAKHITYNGSLDTTTWGAQSIN